MVHPKKTKQILDSSKLVALGLLESVVGLAFLCAKFTQKLVRKASRSSMIKKKILGRKDENKDFDGESIEDEGEELWQRSILMGDKCEPLDFSGVIYYDCNGNVLHEPPMKSPRAISMLPPPSNIPL